LILHFLEKIPPLKKIYFSDSTLYRSEISIKDKKGRVIEWISECPPQPKVSTSYYSSGLIKEEFFPQPIYGLSKTVYKYDELNLKTEIHYYENNRTSTEFKYEYSYDKNMNWISQTMYLNREPILIKIRTIKYFEE